MPSSLRLFSPRPLSPRPLSPRSLAPSSVTPAVIRLPHAIVYDDGLQLVAAEKQDYSQLETVHGTPDTWSFREKPLPHRPRYKSRRFFRRPLFRIAIYISVILVVTTIAAVLAITQTSKSASVQSVPSAEPMNNHSLPHNATTPSLPVTNFSAEGAFNGTGLAAIDPTGFSSGSLLIFWQGFDGSLRYSELTNNVWQKSGSGNVLPVKNAANGTSITAISYVQQNTLFWTVFYVDTSSTIQSISKTNMSNIWVPDSIGKQGLKAPIRSGTALSACYFDKFFGATLENPIGNWGIRLFASGLDGLIHEYVFLNNAASPGWQAGFIFPESNGFAGTACRAGGVTNLYLQNSKRNLEVWWRDFNTTQTNSSTHPTGIWNRGPEAKASLRPNSSITVSSVVYFQDSLNQITAIEPAGMAENFTWGTPFSVGGVTGLPGTSLGCQTFFPSDTGPTGLHVYFQSNGSDVVEYLRNERGGQWASNQLPLV